MAGNTVLVLLLMAAAFGAGFVTGEGRQLRFAQNIQLRYRRILHSTRPDIFENPDAPLS